MILHSCMFLLACGKLKPQLFVVCSVFPLDNIFILVSGSLEMFWLRFSCCLLLGFCSPEDADSAAPTVPSEQQSGEADFEDWELGSGSSLLHLLPADSPFVINSPGQGVNCTQRFWLPPHPPVCWENVAEPEEFAKSRLLALQNRAALQAVSTLSGVGDAGVSYNHQARQEVQGILSDHQKVRETVQTMETVFVSLQQKRKEGKEQVVLTRLNDHLANTRDGLDRRARTASSLESHFSTLEKNLFHFQLRLAKLTRR
nr:uncharacterized protein si:ch211-57n23.1 isoform X1 [Nothobranchius furzeri]